MNRRLVRGVLAAATVAGAGWAIASQTSIGHSIKGLARRAQRDARYARASVPGLVYRLRGQHPAVDVDDATLADRVRSTLGPVERALDVPRIHVMVNRRVVRLDGDVASVADARRIERATHAVAGVADVDSHLHIGFSAAETRPSEGVGPAPSKQYRSLARAAQDAGAVEADRAVHAVLLCFLARIPQGERAHVWVHLPRDVRAAASPALLEEDPAREARTLEQFAGAVAARTPSDREHMPEIIRAVLGALREALPEEAGDVATTLPPELRDAWLGAEAPVDAPTPA